MCPEDGCKWSFRRHLSWRLHHHRWHPDSTLSDPKPEYQEFPPDTPNDPAFVSAETLEAAETPEVLNSPPEALNSPLGLERSTPQRLANMICPRKPDQPQRAINTRPHLLQESEPIVLT